MKVYVLQDDDPYGGYLCAQQDKPDMRYERSSVREVREIEFPDDVWNDIVIQGGLPVDEDGSNDSTWREWWPTGETVWSR